MDRMNVSTSRPGSKNHGLYDSTEFAATAGSLIQGLVSSFTHLRLNANYPLFINFTGMSIRL